MLPISSEPGDNPPRPPTPTHLNQERRRLGYNHCQGQVERIPLLYMYQKIPGSRQADKEIEIEKAL